jgi:hypothetical protein
MCWVDPILDRLDHPPAERPSQHRSYHSLLLQLADKLQDWLELRKIAVDG